MRTGRSRMGRLMGPNRSPRARKAPAPRTRRERPGTRRVQTSPKSRRPQSRPANRRAAQTARARTRRKGPTRRAASLPTTSARLARPNPRQIRKHRDPQLATTSQPARIPLSRVPPRKEMAVRRLRVSRTPRKPTAPPRTPARRMRAASQRGLVTARISRASPWPVTPPETRHQREVNPRTAGRTPRATRNQTRTRLHSDRERSRPAVPPAPK